MALNIGSISSVLTSNNAAQLAELARTNSMHYTANGLAGGLAGVLDGADGQQDALTEDALSIGALGANRRAGAAASGAGEAKPASFEQALLKAMDGVSGSQNKSDDLLQRIVADPNSVDAQDVTIAMAEANMSLNLAKTIMSRIVTAWKDVINTR
jgi:flagellar hook-basal body complex protein FliE